MKLQVIEFTEDNLLLGTDFFEKTQAQWNFKDCTLKLTYNNRGTTVETTHSDQLDPYEESEKEDNEIQDELEYELKDLDEVETYHSETSNSWDEEVLYANPWQDENPVVYLTEIAEIKKSKFQIEILEDSQEQI